MDDVVVPSVEVAVIFALPMSAQHPNPLNLLEKIIMAKARTPKKTSTNGDARSNGAAAVPVKQASSALQTSSAADSNVSRAKPSRPSLVTDTSVYPSVSEDQIRRRAYELYTQRGGGDGRHVEDWFRAEAELLGRR
jgi:hypothetical protein